MKEKWNNLSKKDQLSLVVLLFLLLFAGLYFGINKSKEQIEILEEENSVLVQKQDLVNGLLRVIPKMEEDYKENMSFLKENYDEIHQLNESPIAFEEMFLGWLNGHRVKVVSFDVTSPVLIPMTIDKKEEELSPYEMSIATLNGEIEIENDDKDENKDKRKDKKSKKEEEVVYSAFKQTYTYEVDMSEELYKFVIDKLNGLSDYYYLNKASFVYDNDEPDWGTAVFSIDVYIYERPDIFKKVDNLSYFEYDVLRPQVSDSSDKQDSEKQESNESNDGTQVQTIPGESFVPGSRPSDNKTDYDETEKGKSPLEEDSLLNDRSKFGIINAKGEYINGKPK